MSQNSEHFLFAAGLDQLHVPSFRQHALDDAAVNIRVEPATALLWWKATPIHSELEHEVGWKTVEIALNGLVEVAGFNAARAARSRSASRVARESGEWPA
jgi:hypothetical protein